MVVFLCLGAAAAVGLADQYWVSYEAENTFPEDEGWNRLTFYGGAQRWLEDGALVIDSRDSIMISDSYNQSRPGNLDPDLGEVFVMQWRLRIDSVGGPWDPSVGVFSDGQRAVTLDFAIDRVRAFGGAGWIASFEPGVFHEYEIRSADMLSYDFYVDQTRMYTGEFWGPTVDSSFVDWGDGTQGGTSLACWDYFRFGVVAPEPFTVWPAVVLCLGRSCRARARCG